MADSRLKYIETATAKSVGDPRFLAEGEKRELYTDYVDSAGTRRNAMSIVTSVTAEQKKRVQDILARAR